MDPSIVSTALSQMVDVSFKVAGPYLLVGLVIGLIMSLLQALTQLQEPALVFVPKVLAVVVLMGLLGSWSMDALVGYTIGMFDLFGAMLAP